MTDTLDGPLGRCYQSFTQGAIALTFSPNPVHLPQANSAKGDITHDLHHISKHPLHPFEVEETADEGNHDRP